MIGKIADGVVGTVRYGYAKKTWLSSAALLLVLALSMGWIMVNALRFNPFVRTYDVKVELQGSGGLLINQDVTYHGVQIGRIEDLTLDPDGVNANVRLESAVKIPAETKVRVSGLSAAGEQFLDFYSDTPNTDAGYNGPFLEDGSVISRDRATLPVTLAELLANGDGLSRQLSVEKTKIIRKELSLSPEGPEKLADIIDGGTFLLATLDGVLPETSKTLRTSRIALDLIGDKNAGLKAAANNIDSTMTGADKMRDGYRRLLAQTPATLGQVDAVINDNSDTMVQLLGNTATISQVMYLRVPALNSIWTEYRGSLMDAIGSTMHDSGVWVNLDIYPRYACDYGTPRLPPSAADYPEPFLYTYCRDDDPAVLIRGAKNAPRPAGDDTAGPPVGADLGKQSDPTPKGRYSVPTDYGGPTLPIEPPR
ncbi:MlaD family protein [Mycolicibacterium fallax]|uniref:Mammalian cell entry protein n=1 Tax=Mycolicibacterium fallax TaxID=1793 RepID=A0A1X1RDX4_MYCFA|nr:MlaD family protein [Mycolicibacterium fallax]ORV03627.1 mammalian cell entry protein [Mycolicibacterium fallax]BBY99398.1 mammalian cell entry protein [Mycolicibacterium fallax]HOW93206.1 MlaD family protein [Mycolicibacterium fallax]HSA41366.1 MlaD family protein [Mycobacterium sp.]